TGRTRRPKQASVNSGLRRRSPGWEIAMVGIEIGFEISIERSLRTALTAVAFGMLPVSGGIAMAGSLGGPLQLQDEGSFFVNGQQTASTHPGTAAGGISQPGTITVNQMYVQYRIPQEVRGPTIVMVHGSGHTGATYETTPDGREGWATYFARKGFP